jgi:DNA (cytosine-5)-methyltransferase 1
VDDGAANTLNRFDDASMVRATHLIVEQATDATKSGEQLSLELDGAAGSRTQVPDRPTSGVAAESKPSRPRLPWYDMSYERVYPKLTVGSLFSGVGGADLGMEAAGLETRWFCEIDPWRRKVLEARWPDRPIYEDVKEIHTAHGDQPEPVDVLVGGFPCQDLSTASAKRAGLAGKRSGLFWEFQRIAATSQPRWIVVENVVGLLTGHGGRDFATVLDALESGGYQASWRVLDSRFFGVPQRRRRVFIVAARRDLGADRAAEVLLDPEGSGWRPQARLRTASDVAAAARQRLALRGRATGGVMPTHPLFGVDSVPVNDVVGTLKTDCGHRLDTESIDGHQVLIVPRPPTNVRKLMPVEAERLQGWPDNHTAPPGLKAADTRRYNAIGDGVTAPVAEWIGRRLREVEKEIRA